MASIQTPKFLTVRKSGGARRYLWQPPTRLNAQGWKAVALQDADGKASSLALAMAQAQWLNAIFDHVQEGRVDLAQLMRDTWMNRLSGKGFGLPECAPVAYVFPGLDGKTTKAPPQRRSVSHLIAEYTSSPDFENVRPRTKQDYARMLADLDTLLGPDRVADQRRGRLTETYQLLIKRHGKHSANARMRVLSIILAHAVKLEWLEANPLTRFSLLPLEGRIVIPDWHEVEALIAAARDWHGGPRHDLVLLICAATDTGQRRGDLVESLTLKNFREGRMMFAQQKRGAFINLPVMQELENAGVALITHMEAIHGNLETRFRELKLSGVRKWWFRHLTDAPLLWNMDTGLPMDRFSASRLFRELRKRAAVTTPSVARLRLMDFRDLFITELFRAGCSDAQAASISGHSLKNIEMKRKHYVDRHDPVMQQDAVEKLKAHRNRRTVA